MMRFILKTLFFTLVLFFVEVSSMENQNATRHGKFLSIFQVINFPNDACIASSSRNGTCFTSEECLSKGGTIGGSCAQGFGVCCIFSISCGGATSQNCTYLVQTATTSPSSDLCSFTICKCSSNICRIRLDFATFSIAGPTTGSVDAAAAPENNGGSIGDCNTDTFTVTSPGNPTSPVICGFNSGQHMIVDASDACHRASFDFSGTGTSRQFDIKVTQFACGDEQGGPDGCLQYFVGNSGTFASFNFPTSSATVTSTATHLSNQCYTICFRQEVGKCGICFTPVTVGASTSAQGSFGLSLSFDALAKGVQDTACSQDYLQIPGSSRDAAGADAFVVGTIPAIVHERICGRFFSHTDTAGEGGDVNTESICSQQVPFRVHFKTDENELSTGAGAGTTNEQALFPGGIIGFNLHYALQDC